MGADMPVSRDYGEAKDEEYKNEALLIARDLHVKSRIMEEKIRTLEAKVDGLLSLCGRIEGLLEDGG